MHVMHSSDHAGSSMQVYFSLTDVKLLVPFLWCGLAFLILTPDDVFIRKMGRGFISS